MLKAGIIARGKNDNIYFVNPLIIWNGDRARFVTEYVKKSKKKKPISDPNQLTLDFQEESPKVNDPSDGGDGFAWK